MLRKKKAREKIFLNVRQFCRFRWPLANIYVRVVKITPKNLETKFLSESNALKILWQEVVSRLTDA